MKPINELVRTWNENAPSVTENGTINTTNNSSLNTYMRNIFADKKKNIEITFNKSDLTRLQKRAWRPYDHPY